MPPEALMRFAAKGPLNECCISLGTLGACRIVMSSPRIVASAEKITSTTIDTYFAPNLTIRDLQELIKSGKMMDPLKDFSEAVREERRPYASL